MTELSPGDILWTAPEIAVGREQSGRRPALVVAGADYLSVVDTLAIVVPITSVDRGWPNHVRIRGGTLPDHSWAMTEQIRTISRERIVARDGRADAATMTDVRVWVRDFLAL